MSESSETSLMIEADGCFLKGSLHSASCIHHCLATLHILSPSVLPPPHPIHSLSLSITPSSPHQILTLPNPSAP